MFTKTFNKKELYSKIKEECEIIEYSDNDLENFFSNIPYIIITEEELSIELNIEVYELNISTLNYDILEMIINNYYINKELSPTCFSWNDCYFDKRNKSYNINLTSYSNNYSIDYGIFLEDKNLKKAIFFSLSPLTEEQQTEIISLFNSLDHIYQDFNLEFKSFKKPFKKFFYEFSI